MEEDIPNQKLSVDEALRPIDKKKLVSALEHGDFEISNRSDNTSNNKFEVMRKFQLITKNDIQSGNTSSALVDSFKNDLTTQIIENIKNSVFLTTKVSIAPLTNIKI